VHTFSPRIDTMPGLCRCFALTAIGLALLSSPVLAQGLTNAPTDVTPAAVTTGPSLDNATSGIRANVAHEDLTSTEAAQRAASGSTGGINKGVIILIVGGAAIAGGILIGGPGGTALAIGGALVALYGIYLLLQ
jgi:hypothetical protein